MADNNFLIFDENNATAMSQANYSASSVRINGITAGLAERTLYDKLFRQTSIMASVVGEVIKERGITASDSSFASLLASFRDIVSSSNKVISPVADLAALRAINTSLLADSSMIVCKTTGIYRFDTASSLADNANTVIAPTIGGGRWIKLSVNYFGANTFTGDQDIVDGDLGIKSTTGTANKRWFKFKTYTDYLQLNAINDAGAIVRGLVRFVHDGGVRLLSRLWADGIIQLANGIALTGTTTGGAERHLVSLAGDNGVYLGDNNQPTILQGSSFTYPTTILAVGTNMTTIAVNGRYAVQSPPDAPSFQGLPFNSWWYFEVTRYNASYLYQECTNFEGYPSSNVAAYKAIMKFRRMLIGGAWTGWEAVPITAYVGSNVNLNDLRFPGTYRFDSGSTNGPPVNCDYSVCTVEVGNTDTLVQKISKYNTNEVWTRTGWGNGSNWSPWYRLSQDRGWKTVTLSTGTWQSQSRYYTRYYIIADSDYGAGDSVDFEVGFGAADANQFYAQIESAENAGMSNSVYPINAGQIIFLAKETPSMNLTVRYRINKG